MGYWKSNDGQIIGDTPADIMTDALRDINKAYMREMNRPVTLKEVLATLRFITETSIE